MSNQSLAVRLYAEPLRTLAFGSISNVYAGLGTALANPCRQFIIVNTTDVILFFSLDGITDHFVVPSNGQFVSDVASNATQPAGGIYLAQGDRLYVSGLPSLGSV